MAVSNTTKLQLAFRSGNMCAFWRCECPLVIDSESSGNVAITGDAAHIAGQAEGGPRYDPNMSDEERDHFNNLIYLCGDHHSLIDKLPEDYPTPMLLKMKKDHEGKVSEAIRKGFAEVAFPELARATQWISKIVGGKPSLDFVPTPPDEKIRINELTTESELTIKMGLGIVKEVHEFLEQESVSDADFPERLKAGFLEEYYRLRRNGAKGDTLFDLMCGLAQQGMTTQAERSAGLAVLIYLFDRCEVFEK